MEFAEHTQEEEAVIPEMNQSWFKEEGEEETQEDAFPELTIEPLTKSTYMNEIYALGKALQEKRCSLRVFKNRLNSEILRFFEIYKNFLQLYCQTPLVDEMGKRAQQVFKSLEKYQKSLEKLYHFTENPEKDNLEEGLNQAVEAIKDLTIAYEEFSESQSPESTKKCKNCGHPNPLGTLYCNSCSTLFILDAGELPIEFSNLKWKIKKTGFSFGAAPYPSSLIEVYENYIKIAGGEILKEKYLENVDWIITQFELSRQKLEREMYTASQETLNSSPLLFDGLDRAKRTLEKLRDRIAFDQTDKLDSEWNNLLIAIHTIDRSSQ